MPNLGIQSQGNPLVTAYITQMQARINQGMHQELQGLSQFLQTGILTFGSGTPGGGSKTTTSTRRGRKTLSPEAREKMRLAAQKRWATRKQQGNGQQETSQPTARRRTAQRALAAGTQQ